jgi:hypothetical protein
MTTTTGTAHYHVYAGVVGCLPDHGEMFTNKRDAEQFAAAEARDLRDVGYTVTGNAENGYSYNDINRLYVERCTEPACMEGGGY